MTLFAFYGSLREGGHLHDAYVPTSSRPVGAGVVSGFAMYKMNKEGFPRVHHSAGDSIWVEVYDIDSISAKKVIRMEESAGYRREEVAVLMGHGREVRAAMFVCGPPTGGHRSIESGDWMAFSGHRVR